MLKLNYKLISIEAIPDAFRIEKGRLLNKITFQLINFPTRIESCYLLFSSIARALQQKGNFVLFHDWEEKSSFGWWVDGVKSWINLAIVWLRLGAISLFPSNEKIKFPPQLFIQTISLFTS